MKSENMTASTLSPEHEHYLSMAATYDSRIPAILPMDDLFFAQALSFIPSSARTLLELGSGTGYATARVLIRNPGITVHAIDHAPEMIRCAREKPGLDTVSFYEQDIRDPWPGQGYDVIMSTLCLHHIPEYDRMEVLKRIYEQLSAGGVFICGDIIRPEDRKAEDLYRKRWIRHMENKGMSDQERMTILRSRDANYDDMETVLSFPAKMRYAGFSLVLMPYRHEISAVFVGYRDFTFQS